MKTRYETKYILNSMTAALLKQRVSAAMRPDAHSDGRYTVHNIYFDSIYDSFYNEKHIGAFIRDKYRIRWYNNDFSFIRLERKHKEGALSSKRSVLLSKEQLDMLIRGDFSLNMDDPLWEEFINVHRLCRLRPSAAFSYLREAYCHDSGDTRVTFDSQIARAEGFPRVGGVLELKYSRFLPDFISNMLGGVPLTQTEMSKYCVVMEQIRRLKPYGKFTRITV